jgi:tRNA modification GTPase
LVCAVKTTEDTIAAIATARGNAGVGIIRISGPNTPHIIEHLTHRSVPARVATLADLHASDGELIDQVLMLYFPAPSSFTGEHVLEIHGHGGMVIQDMLLQHVLSLGCRQARPGEFSERAFLNGKLDLTQAEAIADLIESHSRQAAKSAIRSLQGQFSERVHDIVDRVVRLRVLIEAHLDFSDEEIGNLPVDEFASRLSAITRDTHDLLVSARQGHVLRDGIHLVLAGRPNAGKSSLLNRLTESDAAIISDTPGTTRDVIRERIHIDGIPLDVSDTAGLRVASDDIEAEGVNRTVREMQAADRILLIVDDHDFLVEDREEGPWTALLEEIPADTPVTLIRNKIDLTRTKPSIETGSPWPVICLSAKTGNGVELLTDHLRKTVGLDNATEGVFSARRRHIIALSEASQYLDHARQQLSVGLQLELMAEDLRLVQQNLAEITGEFTSEDLLGEIFGSFCIGK